MWNSVVGHEVEDQSDDEEKRVVEDFQDAFACDKTVRNTVIRHLGKKASTKK
jgi:hypothetical protein